MNGGESYRTETVNLPTDTRHVYLFLPHQKTFLYWCQPMSRECKLQFTWITNKRNEVNTALYSIFLPSVCDADEYRRVVCMLRACTTQQRSLQTGLIDNPSDQYETIKTLRIQPDAFVESVFVSQPAIWRKSALSWVVCKEFYWAIGLFKE